MRALPARAPDVDLEALRELAAHDAFGEIERFAVERTIREGLTCRQAFDVQCALKRFIAARKELRAILLLDAPTRASTDYREAVS